jgi:hypothetical protein
VGSGVSLRGGVASVVSAGDAASDGDTAAPLSVGDGVVASVATGDPLVVVVSVGDDVPPDDASGGVAVASDGDIAGALAGGVSLGAAAADADGAGAVGTATTITLPPLDPFFVEVGTTTSWVRDGERMTVCNALPTVGRWRGADGAIGAQSGFALAGHTVSTLAKLRL